MVTGGNQGTYVQQTGYFGGVSTGTLLVLEPEGHVIQVLQREREQHTLTHCVQYQKQPFLLPTD